MTAVTLRDLEVAGERVREASEQYEWARSETANALASGDDDAQQRALSEEADARREYQRAAAAFAALRAVAPVEVAAAHLDAVGDPLA